MLHQIDSRETVVFQIFSRIIRFEFRSLVFFFRSCRFHLKSRFRLFQRVFLHNRSRIGNSRFKYHSHSFTLVRYGSIFLFRFINRKVVFRFFSLNIHHWCRRRCLFIRPFQIKLHFLRLGSRKFRIAFSFRNILLFFFLFAFQETQCEEFTQPDDGTCTYIYEETDSRYQQDHPHTGYSNLRDQPTTDIISVHTSQINEGILIMIHKGKSEEYGEPDQQECAADKPLPQTYNTYTH